MIRPSLVASLVGAFVSAPCALAQVVVYQTGFEQPAFVAGPLLDQDLWSNDPPQFQSSVVQSAVVKSGAQAMEMIGPATDPMGTTWHFRPVNYTVSGPNQFVRIRWDMRIASSPSNDPSTAYGVEVFDPSFLARHALVFVSSVTGTLNVLDTSVGSMTINTGIAVPHDEWKRYEIVLDFISRSADVYYEGALVVENVLWDADVFPPSNTIADADFRITNPGDDSCFIDNFSITAGPVGPCPGDANADGAVDFNDITEILGNWLAPAPVPNAGGDANADGVVDFNDITETLGNWLSPCS